MHSPEVVASHDLPNGLRVLLLDQSRHYYGGYWQAVLEVHCRVPLSAELFTDSGMFADARRLLGEVVPFVRRLEKMAVRQDLMDQARRELVERFERHLLPFLSNEKFPARFIASEFDQRRKRTVRGIPCQP